jgi:DNA-binding NtrC family response regulator
MVIADKLAVAHPTVLVALNNDDALRGGLVQQLRRDGFLVLEADDWEQVLRVAKTHSRPIQVMVTTDNMPSHTSILEQHRPQLQFLSVNASVDADQVMMQVREIFGSRTAAMPIGKASAIVERTPEERPLKLRG